MALDASTGSLFAGTATGLFRSMDAGSSWTRVLGGLPYRILVDAILIHPDGLLLGTDKGIYRSTDAGDTWGMVLATQSKVNDLAFAASDPLTVYACTYYYVLTDNLFKSTDGGITWASMPSRGMYKLAVKPDDSSILYGGDNNGVWKSLNGGVTWSPTTLWTAYIRDMKFVPGQTRSLFAASDGYPTRGLFRTDDAGGTWKRLDGAGLACSSIEIDPGPYGLMYVAGYNGIRRSADGGKNWEFAGYGFSGWYASDMVIDLSNPANVYACNNMGVSKTTFYGSNWALQNTGLRAASVAAIAVEPSDPSLVFASTAGGLHDSTDAGQTWSLTTHFFDSRYNYDVQVDPATHALYVLTGFLAKSTDSGVTWSFLQPDHSVDMLAHDPVDSNTLYAGAGLGGFSRSIDGGATWNFLHIFANGLTALAADPVNSGVLFTSSQFTGMFKSTDGGASWMQINAGLVANPWGSTIAIHPSVPQTLFVGSGSGVFRSIDAGASWQQVFDLPTSTINSLAFGPPFSSVLYAATSLGVWRSPDAGSSWIAMSNGIAIPDVLDFAVDPISAKRLHASTRGDGVYEYDLSCNIPAVSPASIPAPGCPGAYSQDLVAAGGAAPYAFALNAGSLPPGLSLDSTGTLSGTNSGAGTFRFAVAATDAAGCTGTQTYTMVIPGPVVQPDSLPEATTGLQYSQQFTAPGGQSPFVFSVSSGTLPPGLVLSAGGLLQGIPTQAGVFPFTVSVADNTTCTSARSYALQVVDPCLYCDDFEDGVLSSQWTYAKGTWAESGGVLSGSATRKATAYAIPAFAGCSICSVETEVEVSSSLDAQVWLIGWRADSKNWVELMAKASTERWILRQRKNGTVVAKSKVQFQLQPNRKYQLRISFDGAEFTAYIDGVPSIQMLAAPGTAPHGTIGFQSKGVTAQFSYVSVN